MSEGVTEGGQLSERLSAIQASYPSAHPAMVTDVVRAVVETLSGRLSSQDRGLLAEVEDLGRAIASAKQELGALGMESAGNRVADASGELDAVVRHTAEATDTILEACELLQADAANPAGLGAATVQEATTRIFEACSFQDITGQRIQKVVGILKMVETRVSRIVAKFGPEFEMPSAQMPIREDPRPDGHLLNGPQPPTMAMAQADVDALLADF